MYSLLLIEDDPGVIALLTEQLSDYIPGITITSTSYGKEGITLAKSGVFSAVLLDLKLPDLSGLDICRDIRSTQPNLPLIMLTGRKSEIDRVVGLEVGADDYVVKPFDIQELALRIQALIRRRGYSDGNSPSTIGTRTFGDLRIDFENSRVTVGEKFVELTVSEFALLRCFAMRPGVVLGWDELLGNLEENTSDVDGQGRVKSHIARLRKKLSNDPQAFIITVRGVGYRFLTH